MGIIEAATGSFESYNPPKRQIARQDERPQILRLQKGKFEMRNLLEQLKDVRVHDRYDRWLVDRIKIDRPSIRIDEGGRIEIFAELKIARSNEYDGTWAYYPWKNTVTHIPSEEECLTDEFQKRRLIV